MPDPLNPDDHAELWSNRNVPSPIERTIAPLQIVPAKPDRELAEEIRQRIISVIDPLLAEMSAAKRQGFDVLLGIQTDAQGKSFLQNLKIVKEF